MCMGKLVNGTDEFWNNFVKYGLGRLKNAN